MSKGLSAGEYDAGLCDYSKRSRVHTSRTSKNPGRRFLTCEEDGCNFFIWIDDGVSGRAKEILIELSQKKSFVEEKLKPVEENLMAAEGKLKAAEEKLARKVLKKKMKKSKNEDNFVKNCIVVVLIVVVVMLLNNKMVPDRKYLL
ncbi:hypothetical protein AgCh_039282 [Apium graveolens]